MYSPKVKEELIPILYKLGKIKNRPMTKLVNEAIEEYLEKHKNLIKMDIIQSKNCEKRE